MHASIARFLLASLLLIAVPGVARAGDKGACPALLEHSMQDIRNQPRDLCDFRGKVLLVVNTASQCGYTPQYEGLQRLNERYAGRGLVVLGFPSNDFGGQEPGSNEAIGAFCVNVYGVGFPMFAKTGVSARNANAFYRDLAARTGRSPQWNFHKYLVSRDGAEVLSFASPVEPESPQLVSAIERMLDAPAGRSR